MALIFQKCQKNCWYKYTSDKIWQELYKESLQDQTDRQTNLQTHREWDKLIPDISILLKFWMVIYLFGLVTLFKSTFLKEKVHFNAYLAL